MGLPPTSSKLSTDTNNVTTFFYDFPNFTGTHSGVTVTLGTNLVAGGGTGVVSLTPNEILTSGTTSTGNFQQIPAVSAGYVLTDNGSGNLPTFQPAPGTVSSFYASSQVTTQSSSNTGTSFTTFSNSPAFTITPAITGTYKVYCSVPVQQNANIQPIKVRVFNTSGGATLLQESQGTEYDGYNVTSIAIYNSIFIQSTYTLTSGTTYVFDIQGLSDGSTTFYIRGDQAAFYMFAELEVVGTVPTGVVTLNGESGAVTLVAGSNVTITPSGSNITIASTSSAPALAYYYGPVATTSASINSASFTVFSNSPTLTFTPTATGTYLVSASIPTQGNSDTFPEYAINASTGSPSILAANNVTAYFTSGIAIIQNSTVSALFTLTSGTAYGFDIAGQSPSASTMYLRGDAAQFFIQAQRVL